MIHAAEENGKDPHLRQGFVDFEIIDETVTGHAAQARPDSGLLCAAMGMDSEIVQIIQCVFDARDSPAGSAIVILPETLIGLNEIIFNQIKVAF